jgi:DNA polymerase-1
VVSLSGTKISEAKNYNTADVKEYLGVFPDQVVDYKALVGDTSDNIPGVPGIGQKTAVTLLEQYQTLDEIYAHLDEITGRAFTKLTEGKTSAYISQTLAQIKTDVGISLKLEDAKTDHINVPALKRSSESWSSARDPAPAYRCIPLCHGRRERPNVPFWREVQGNRCYLRV